MRGMILAAGFGTRLQPITNNLPKPMVPVGGRPLIDYHLALMARSGIREVMINLHYFADAISGHVGDGSDFGLKVIYNREEPILGTGGGIKAAEDFLTAEGDCVVINADILIDAEIKDVVAYHSRRDCLATMVLRRLQPQETYTPVRSDGKRVIAIDGLTKNKGESYPAHVYTGMQILSPDCFDYLRSEFSSVVSDLYVPAIDSGCRICAYEIDGFWSDLGTIERYEAVRDNPPFPVTF